jgi:hypothetical protein
MKWAGMYFVGVIVLVSGILAALWKLGILASIGTIWTLIGLSHSGSKENIEINRK